MKRSGRDWVKAHICTGVRINVITAAKIEDRDTADCPQFAPLVLATSDNFKIREVSGDKAYLSRENLELVSDLGATPYIAFMCNSVDGSLGDIWEKMFHFYSLNREAFMNNYHKRSNLESTLAMVKAKFRDNVRSKNEVAKKNEVL